jgi:hypothetical protein
VSGGRPAAAGSGKKTLPELVDNAGIQRELGVKRAAAEAIMRRVPKVTIERMDETA